MKSVEDREQEMRLENARDTARKKRKTSKTGVEWCRTRCPVPSLPLSIKLMDMRTLSKGPERPPQNSIDGPTPVSMLIERLLFDHALSLRCLRKFDHPPCTCCKLLPSCSVRSNLERCLQSGQGSASPPTPDNELRRVGAEQIVKRSPGTSGYGATSNFCC